RQELQGLQLLPAAAADLRQRHCRRARQPARRHRRGLPHRLFGGRLHLCLEEGRHLCSARKPGARRPRPAPLDRLQVRGLLRDPDRRPALQAHGSLQGESGMNARSLLLFAFVAALIVGEGLTASWNTALGIVNMGLISAILALGVNMQWGYAGLFNVGVVGFVALGGLAPVLIATPPVTEVWTANGAFRIIFALLVGAGVIALAIAANKRLAGTVRILALLATCIGGFFLFRALFDPAVDVVEAFTPATYSNIGGLGVPVLLAWPVGALLAAGAAWAVGKTALGLRSDYLAIATLGIGEIIIAVMKNEDWLARGVKNVIGIPRPVRGLPSDESRFRRMGGGLRFRPGDGLDHRGDAALCRALRNDPPRAHLGVGEGAELTLGPHDARNPRQRDGRRGDGQGRDAPASADLHPRLGGLRVGGGDDRDPRQPAYPRHLQSAALHLPDLGHGDRRRFRQQLGRGSRRFPDLVPLDQGRALGQRAYGFHHRRHGRRHAEDP